MTKFFSAHDVSEVRAPGEDVVSGVAVWKGKDVRYESRVSAYAGSVVVRYALTPYSEKAGVQTAAFFAGFRRAAGP
jgi:hypothetical protein